MKHDDFQAFKTKCALMLFARGVLDILDTEPEWDSDTLSSIAELAVDYDLASDDDDGRWRKRPCETCGDSRWIPGVYRDERCPHCY